MIPNFYGYGTLTLLERKEALGIKATKRIELAAEGDQMFITFSTTNDESFQPVLNTNKGEVRVHTEDLMALIQAYIDLIA